jgi:hypothetical protein
MYQQTLIIFLLLAIGYLMRRVMIDEGITTVTPPQAPTVNIVQSALDDTSAPPYKRYKPARFQQMGLLLGPSNETLPLYGREAPYYRDRYNYYTSTPGQQVYSLPVIHNGKECTEDIGCPEFYGNETVTVTGQPGTYTVKVYRTVF